MEIKRTDMKVADKFELKPSTINGLDESKKLLGMTPKFKTMYFNFEVGKGLPNHVHNGYASIFVYEGKVKKDDVFIISSDGFYSKIKEAEFLTEFSPSNMESEDYMSNTLKKLTELVKGRNEKR